MKSKNKILAVALSVSFVIGGASVAEANTTSPSTENIANSLENTDKENTNPAVETLAENQPSGDEADKEKSLQPTSFDVSPEDIPQPVGAAETPAENKKPEYKESDIVKDEKVITDGKGYRQSEIAGQGNKIKVINEDLGNEKEGVRVEVQNPSPTSDDKKSFGVEVNIDKKKVDRTYNGFLITDSVRGAKAEDNGGFLDPGQTLPSNTEDTVTYKPEATGKEFKNARQARFDYNSTEKDRKYIANKDTGKTTLAWQGKYTDPNPNQKMFKGTNFEVSVGVNPYPNENKDLSLITIEGDTTISKVPVKNQYVVSTAKIKNAGDEDYTRLVGEVYHPDEDILVEGAKALIVTPDNIENLKNQTGNSNLSVGQIVFKMPEGALQNDGSIFNDDKFKGVQNLRAKFFARPRTKEEFQKAALTEYYEDVFVYESTGAGTKEITHNGEKVTIDKQGIDRYDHYNLIGEMTINLDDTKNYDQTFNRIQSKDDTAYSNTVTPGGSINLKINSPSGKEGDPSKSYEDMKNAKDNGLADGKILEEFKKQAEAKGWKVETKADNPSEFTVTAPADARPGDTMYLPIEYKYTNGSKDYHSFYFVVKETNNVKPEYHAEVGFQGDTLTNTPDITLSDKPDINNPASYELVPGEYKDDKGNVWKDVTIDKDTGVVTAKVPDGEGVNIIGGENVYIPVKVNYTDKLTGEAKTEIVKAQFIARPKYKATVKDEDIKDVPFASKEEFDENLPLGTIKVIKEGKAGKEKTVFEQDVVNGKKGLIDPETGKFTEGENLFRKVTTTIEEKEDRLVKVGIKPVEETVTIPKTVEIEVDPNMEATDKPVVVEEGNDGVVTVKTKKDPQTGAITIDKQTTTEAKPKKVKVGSKTTGTVVDEDKIPFGVKVEKDPSLKKGEWKYKKDENGEDLSGKVGTNKKTWTIVNSKVVGEPTVEETKPVDAVILVGDENFTGEVKHDVEEKIPFKVQVIEDPTMDKGKTEVVQTGVEGTKTTTYTQAIENGQAKGDMTSTVKSTTEAKDHIIKIGTKPLTGSTTVTSKNEKPFDVEIIYDNTKPIGFVEEKGGLVGEETKTTEVKAEDGTVIAGETSTKEDKAPVKKTITVGTKDYTGEFTHEYTEIDPYETEIVFDNTMKAGEKKVVTEGVNGKTKTSVSQSFTNGTLGEKKVQTTEEVKKVNQVIKVGSMTEGQVTHVEEIPYSFRVVYDPTIPAGKYSVYPPAVKGRRTTTWNIKNSEVVGDPIVEESRPTDAIIKVGNKDFTGTFETVDKDPVPFEVEYKIDPSLKPGEEVVDQEGELGEKSTTTTHSIKNGKVESSTKGETKQTKAPVKKIVRIGAKTDGTYTHKEEIPFEVEVRVNKDLAKGKYNVVQQGEKGEKTTTLTIENSKVLENPKVETTKEAKKHIIEVGDKDFVGTVSHDVVEEIPFAVKVVEDPTMDKGKSEVQQQGVAGSKTTTYTQKIKNGGVDGEMTSSVKSEKAPVEHIIRVGTKPLTGSTSVETKNQKPFDVEIEYDNTKPAGTVEIVEGTGVPGEETKTTPVTSEDGTVTPGETTTKEDKAPINKKIIVGTQGYNGEFKHEYTNIIPFETEVEIDPSLAPNEVKEVQAGVNGETKTTVTQTITNGVAGEKQVSEPETTKKPVNRKIKVGAKTEGKHSYTEELPFKYEVKVNPEREAGTYEIIKPGKVGSKTTEWTIRNSVAGEGKVTAETTAENAVIEVGNKDFTGEVTHTDKKEIPFEVEIVENPNLLVGTSNVKQQGEAGEIEVTYTQAIKNGKADGELEIVETGTKAPKKHIIEVGTKPVEGNTHNVDENVNVEIEYVTDENLEKGKVETGDLVPGKVTSKLVNKIVDGKVVTEEVKEVTPAKQIIKVGAKDYTGTFETVDKNPLPFEVEYKVDPKLKSGEEVVDQEGELGEESTTTTHKIVNGKVTESTPGEKTQTKAPVKKIVRIGAKTDGEYTHKEEVPFEVEVRVNKDLAKGEYKVIQEGKNGEKTVTVKVENSKVLGDPTSEISKAPQKHIIEVGDKDFTGEVSHEVTEEIGYEVEIIEDETLDAGTIVVDKEGSKGSKTTKYTQRVKNGEADGNLKSEVINQTPAQKKIIRVGKKAGTCPLPEDKPVEGTTTDLNKEIPVEIEYVYDNTKDKGLVEKGKVTPGKVETKIVSKVIDGKVVNTEETVITPAKQIIIVGSKDQTSEVKTENQYETPFETEVIYDKTIEAGKVEEIQAGEKGLDKTITKVKLVNGKEVDRNTETTTLKNPTKRIIRVGVKEIVKEVEVDKLVEIVKEVPVEKIVELIKEIPVEKRVEIIKEVPVEKIVEIIKEIPAEKQVQIIKEVPVEVLKEISIETIKDCPGIEIRYNKDLKEGEIKVVDKGQKRIVEIRNGEKKVIAEGRKMIVEVGSQKFCKPEEKPSEDPKDEKPGEKPSEDPKNDKPGEKPSEDPKNDKLSEKPSKDPKEDKPGEKPSKDPKEDKPGEKPSKDPKNDKLSEKPSKDPKDDKSGDKPGEDSKDEEESKEEKTHPRKTVKTKNSRINKENPKTGISSLGAILGALGISLGGLKATKKKKEDK